MHRTNIENNIATNILLYLLLTILYDIRDLVLKNGRYRGIFLTRIWVTRFLFYFQKLNLRVDHLALPARDRKISRDPSKHDDDEFFFF